MPATKKCSTLLTTAALAGLALAAPTHARLADSQYLCGQTAHFFFDDGSGVLQPGVITSTFELNVQFTPNGASISRRGYDYYKAQSDLNAAALQNNPYFKDNATAGEMPSARTIRVLPINDPPVLLNREAGLFVPVDNGLPPFDLWGGMDMRVQFFDAQDQLAFSFLAEGGLTLTGEGPGQAFDLGLTNTYSYKSGVGPLKWMAPESIRRGAPSTAGLWLSEITVTMTLVPTPSASILLGAGAMVAMRRRRSR